MTKLKNAKCDKTKKTQNETELKNSLYVIKTYKFKM